MPKKQRKFQIKASCYDVKGRLLSTGLNSYTKTHPVVAHFSKLAGTPEKIYLHAEIQAVLRAKDKVVDTVAIERYDSEGKTAMAKPCSTCALMLKAYGVRFVRYTTDQGEEIEKL